jgi:hypothetical protein
MLVANRQPEFVNPEHLELAKKRVIESEATQRKCLETITTRVHKDDFGNSSVSDLVESAEEEEEE